MERALNIADASCEIVAAIDLNRNTKTSFTDWQSGLVAASGELGKLNRSPTRTEFRDNKSSAVRHIFDDTIDLKLTFHAIRCFE